MKKTEVVINQENPKTLKRSLGILDCITGKVRFPNCNKPQKLDFRTCKYVEKPGTEKEYFTEK
jgi:hypothetical protein